MKKFLLKINFYDLYSLFILINILYNNILNAYWINLFKTKNNCFKNDVSSFVLFCFFK